MNYFNFTAVFFLFRRFIIQDIYSYLLSTWYMFPPLLGQAEHAAEVRSREK